MYTSIQSLYESSYPIMGIAVGSGFIISLIVKFIYNLRWKYVLKGTGHAIGFLLLTVIGIEVFREFFSLIITIAIPATLILPIIIGVCGIPSAITGAFNALNGERDINGRLIE